jgi:tetratricopeptide (TPR) repeat protein
MSSYPFPYEQLREFDRCRTLYGRFLEFNPANCSTWTRYAELETELGDIERARAIYELAVGQPLLDMPEVLWKAYIDFEFEILGEHDRARNLYRRLLQKTSHVKVPPLAPHGAPLLLSLFLDLSLPCPLWPACDAPSAYNQVWISFAQFEAAIPVEGAVDAARKVHALVTHLTPADVRGR